jgi:adenylate cyclase
VSLLQGVSPGATPTSNSEAYTLYLQARWLWDRATPATNATAIDYLKRVVALDSKFAPAWALLAQALSIGYSRWGTAFSPGLRADAHHSAEQALRLDPMLADAHVAMARVLFEVDWEWRAAGAEIRQALALDPGNADAFRLASLLATSQGRYGEALAYAEGAVARDPLSARSYLVVAEAQRNSGRMVEAEATFRKVLELIPTAQYLHAEYGQLLLFSGHPEAGLAEIERETDPAVLQLNRTVALYVLGRNEEADRVRAYVERKYGADWPLEMAELYAWRHDPERAFVWLDRAYRQHEFWLVFIKQDGFLDSLLSDARYKALLLKMKLAE